MSTVVILSFNKVKDPRLAMHWCVRFMTRLNRNIDLVYSVTPAANMNLMLPGHHLAAVDLFRWT